MIPDELGRYFKQEEELRRIADIRRYIDPMRDAYNRLGIDEAAFAIFRQEDIRQKKLSEITNASGTLEFVKDSWDQPNRLGSEIENARRLALIDPISDIRKSIAATIKSQQSYENLFRLPGVSELEKIARESIGRSSLARIALGNEDQLKKAMAMMHIPWLQMQNSQTSADAFSDIIAMGRGIDNLRAFESDFTEALRVDLGDWRDVQSFSLEPMINPVVRSNFYVERGFNPELTDFTQSAFDDGLRIAGLREAESIEDVDDDQESNFVRARQAFDHLLRFEIAIREFIEQIMLEAFGDHWMKQRLPAKMLESWVDKRDKAVKAGCAEEPLINYADFTDYRGIIERKDNWLTVFKPIFGREEDVRESFQRLFPVRIATMHARLITQDDELLLLVETKRILKAIKQK
ncbi:MAG: hypothetical protein K2P84_06815 [Undibacterium sp.]|nr:hypothetical protein [Undibacterium sp.]